MPASTQLTQPKEINYFKEAFYNQYNLITLGGLGALGLMFSGFLYLAGAFELIYMAMVPTDERFQRYVRSEQNRNLLEAEEYQRKETLTHLAGADRNRLNLVRSIVQDIKEVASKVDRSSAFLVEQDLNKLDYLEKTFLRMLGSLTLLNRHLSATNTGQIQQQIEKLGKEIEAASPRVKAIKQRNAQILEQRLSRLTKAEEDREVLEANLDTIEDTLKLIRDNVVSLNNPQGISGQIDDVVVNMQESEKLMASMASLDAEALFESSSDETLPESERLRS